MAEAMGETVRENRLAWEQFSAGMFYEPVDLQQPEDLVKLGRRLEEIDRLRATRSNRSHRSFTAVAAAPLPMPVC